MKSKKNYFYILFITLTMLFVNEMSFAQVVKNNELSKHRQKKISAYESKDGTVYKNGDTLMLGTPFGGRNTFTFIQSGDGLVTSVENLPARMAGTYTTINLMRVIGTERTGFYVVARAKGMVGLLNYSINIEQALENGEILRSKMTSDDALKKLKTAKDKMDLGLITSDEYEKIKSELIKYIK